MANNPAASQGWVKSTDPKTGRSFFANHVTRKTQWEPPDGWIETASVEAPLPAPPSIEETTMTTAQEQPLPSNWEVLHDPTSGKPFYVDHERKITQWTRPQPEAAVSTLSSMYGNSGGSGNGSDQHHLRPAVASPSSGNLSSAMTRLLAQRSSTNNHTTASSSTSRSFQQEHNPAYYTPTFAPTDIDLSDSLPPLEFKVQTVADKFHSTCPHCDQPFSVTKRRHHCRLCGDVFCDACSQHRCELPLSGAEFQKGPVRVCDFCFVDVDQGNFFSMRRYLTVLHLADPLRPDDDMESGSVAAWQNVNAALSALTQDLDQMMSSAEQLEERVTIPPKVLVPVILKHLLYRDTADRAVRCLASLLSLESMAGGTQEYATAVYLYGKATAVSNLLDLLERSSSDRRTLFVQEQAARTLFYLSEGKIVSAVTRKLGELSQQSQSDVDDDDGGYGTVEDALDIPRVIRNMLDHASTAGNPNLQRWAAATLKNLIVEDQRRACLAVNEVAAMVASGERPGQLAYTSHLPDLVSTGGVMILGSLIGADDADTRAHAVTALGATLTSTRAVDSSLAALAEMTGGEFGRMEQKDGEIVRAIVAAGGCAGSVAQLLLSAEHTVAGMGCSFLSALVKPLLDDATASGTLSRQYDVRNDTGNMGACREAALEIATGSCLPALLSLVRADGGSSRPLDLRWIAMETLAATVLSIGAMGRSWAADQYEEGLERFGAPNKLKESIVLLNEEGVVDCALHVLQSTSFGQSLGSSSSKETPGARIRECAGILLSALTSCSAEAIMELQNKNILASLLLASTDSTMTVASTMRGDGSPRCLGVLETVSSLLMFAWQHPSGADKDLLDTLIEMIDSGAIPYISKVMSTKVEWDSRDKAVGGMKGRAASSRFLCCLFGIALTDSTGIGMRRLMDAVESDARSYRTSSSSRGDQSSKQRAPGNLIESALGTLQSASTLARKALIGGAGANQQGEHFQSALMDLVEASLLAAGSMCGSSIAPGGVEGTFVSGESFLESRAADPYVSKRQQICNVTCDVVVRGGSSGQTILPTMVVGGFGEGSALASLRLSLAIAQNGTKEQHVKLALSGILVPISDLLRSALSNGDIYKFSGSLALVRFCGPHIAAGQGGGLESVRDAIRVATNVLILPVVPGATTKQIETQESLKSECISSLESLSKNASLWSSISTDALPAIVRYLQTAALGGVIVSNSRGLTTKCAALRAILQIVQVPSHAVSAAGAGIIDPLGRFLMTEEDEVPTLALEILHVIAGNEQARRKARLLETGLVRAICFALAKSTTDAPKQPTDPRADVTFLGLEILLAVRSDMEADMPAESLLSSPSLVALLDSVASEPSFIRALCSTALLSTEMKLPRHDSDDSNVTHFPIPKLYGLPLLQVPEECAGYASTHEAAESFLFTISVYACALENKKSEEFWNVALLKTMTGNADATECLQTSSTFVAHFLSQLTNDHTPFIPKDTRRQEEFLTITRPLVRHRLLEVLKDSMADLSPAGENVYGPKANPYVTSLLVGFNIPHICLSVWRDPALLDLAFELIKQIVEQDPDEVLHLFVEGKAAIMSLFDLLNLEAGFESSTNVEEIRRFLASVLGQLAENGLLTDAVERFDVRSSAIAALAAAALSEEERSPDEDDDTTSNRLSTVLMRCLVDLCTINKGSTDKKSSIRLASAEAAAIAKNLGKKLCHMVLSRFLERSKLKQYEMEDDENIMDAPDVAMLCAVAQHDEALLTLRSIGGLHALSLIAAEGEVSALVALKKACRGDANVLLEGDTYLSMMSLIASNEHDAQWREDSPKWRQLESSAFDLLASLCLGSSKGKISVAAADNCKECIHRAKYIIFGLADFPKPGSEESPAAPAAEEDITEDVDDEDAASDGEESEDNDEGEEKAKVEAEKPASPKQSAKIERPKKHTEDFDLGVAASVFLSSVGDTMVGKASLRDDSTCIDALSHLATTTCSEPLQFACLQLLVTLAPFASSDGALSFTKLDFTLDAVLKTEKFQTAPTSNSNRFYNTAAEGLIVVFDCLPTERQEALSKCVASHFRKSVKSCIVKRSSPNKEGCAYAAELCHSLTTLMQLARGRSFANTVFVKEVLTAQIHLIQWSQDPKTTKDEKSKLFWDASVTNCLILLASLLSRPEEHLHSEQISLKELSGTTLMLARPGKAPRKAIDVKSALQNITGGLDAAASISAQKLIARLF